MGDLEILDGKSIKPRRKYRVTALRQAQQDQMRHRIRTAAREVFQEQHYSAASMEEIARRAGMRRSTIYLHYKDKAGLLVDMIADYAPRAAMAMATLPGPEPTIGDLVQWVESLRDFFEKEAVVFTVIAEAGYDRRLKPHIDDLVQALLTGLGANNPAFQKAAAQRGDDLEIRAWAVLLVNQLTFVGQAPAKSHSQAWISALRQAFADALQDFLRRFN